MSKIKLALHGASGRMGETLQILLANDPHIELLTMYPTATDTLGETASWLNSHAADIDVVLDFSLPEAFDSLIKSCRENNLALVSGTTGLSVSQQRELESLAQKVAVFWSANMSFGVAVMSQLVKQAAQLMDDSWDIEIFEAHHKFKKDAPSGTALLLGEMAAKGRGVKKEDVFQLQRSTAGVRRKGEIGFASVRGGSEAGLHDVMFMVEGEQLSLSHKASSREAFAAGAVRATHWLFGQSAGLYSMTDLITALPKENNI